MSPTNKPQRSPDRPSTVSRWVVTYVKAIDGRRTLIGPANRHNTYASMADAHCILGAIISTNSQDRINETFGMAPNFQVRLCPCYRSNHQPVDTFFD